ncbi:MAG: GNAT family N-acetyltransferase [Anaerolineales bacterium]|nr:GNAT family N-acetyltransferase [Anaerolineales bacterium]
MHLGRKTHDQIDPYAHSEDFPGIESLQAELAQAAEDQQLDNWLIAHTGDQPDEQVIDYSQIESWPEGDGTWVYLVLGWLLPEWRGQGIGAAMLRWCEGRYWQLAASGHSGEKTEPAANASSTEVFEISVRPAWRRRSLGRALLSLALLSIPHHQRF